MNINTKIKSHTNRNKHQNSESDIVSTNESQLHKNINNTKKLQKQNKSHLYKTSMLIHLVPRAPPIPVKVLKYISNRYVNPKEKNISLITQIQNCKLKEKDFEEPEFNPYPHAKLIYKLEDEYFPEISVVKMNIRNLAKTYGYKRTWKESFLDFTNLLLPDQQKMRIKQVCEVELPIKINHQQSPYNSESTTLNQLHSSEISIKLKNKSDKYYKKRFENLIYRLKNDRKIYKIRHYDL